MHVEWLNDLHGQIFTDELGNSRTSEEREFYSKWAQIKQLANTGKIDRSIIPDDWKILSRFREIYQNHKSGKCRIPLIVRLTNMK